MAIYIPTIQSEYVLQGMLEQETWQQCLAAGIIDESTLQGVLDQNRKAGDVINVPTFNDPPDFVLEDVSSDTPLSPTRDSTTDDKAVVLRAASTRSFKESDQIRSGEDFDRLASLKYGEVIAQRMLGQMVRVLTGAIGAIDTPSTDCHIYDVSTDAAGMTLDHLIDSMSLMGDKARRLNTAIIHSRTWGDLCKSAGREFQSSMMHATALLGNDRLRGLCGISNWIIYDDTNMAAEFGQATIRDNKFSTFLLGTGALATAVQRDPQVEDDKDILVPGTLHVRKVSLNHVIHLKGVKWAGTTIADTDIINPAKWDEAYQDHRNVPAVKLLTRLYQE